MRRGAVGWLGVGVCVVAVGCGSDVTVHQGQGGVCAPGDIDACFGPDQCIGAQACLDDGSGYEACDCGAFCGDGVCERGETYVSCPQDGCECGNGACEWPEDVGLCPLDCFCGNGTCDGGEDYASCPEDGCACGDGTCDSGEDGYTCPADCPCDGGGLAHHCDDNAQCGDNLVCCDHHDSGCANCSGRCSLGGCQHALCP